MSDSPSQTSNEHSENDIWSQAGLADLPFTEDISSLVERLLDQMQAKFSELHEGLATKVKAMDTRLDLLEKHLSDLIDYVGSAGGGGSVHNNLSGKQSISKDER